MCISIQTDFLRFCDGNVSCHVDLVRFNTNTYLIDFVTRSVTCDPTVI